MGIEEGLLEVRDNIKAAAESAGRRADDIMLVAVSKFKSIDDILSAKFKKYLKTSRNIDAPAIVLDELDGRAVLNFIDGRHRFSVLRDMEMTKMPFSLDI